MMQEYDLEAFVAWNGEPEAFMDAVTEPLLEQYQGDIHTAIRAGQAYLSATIAAETLEGAVVKLTAIAQAFDLTIDHIRFYPAETITRHAA